MGVRCEAVNLASGRQLNFLEGFPAEPGQAFPGADPDGPFRGLMNNFDPGGWQSIRFGEGAEYMTIIAVESVLRADPEKA